MDVYGHRSFTLNVPTFLRRFRSRLEQLPAEPDHDAVVDLLVDFGEAYAAIADAGSIEPRCAAALRTIADATCASWHGDRCAAAKSLVDARAHVGDILACDGMRAEVAASTAEGFAHWALYPAQYIVAAERFVRERAPVALLCIGIRNIGAPLAFVVAAAAGRAGVRAEVETVRPTGDPFDRRLTDAHALLARARDLHDADVAIVDEGPGLSGSSFAAVSDALVEGGIAADRITLFPSWNAPAETLRSPRGQAAWRRHARVVAAFEEVWPAHGLVDLSGGLWRARVFGPDETRWPAVQPQHERRKYLRTSEHRAGSGERRHELLRFAGLGRYGRAKRDSARLLADAGFTPPPLSLQRGFLAEPWIEGERLEASRRPRRETLDRLAAYAAFLRTHCQTGSRAVTADLAEALDAPIGGEFDEPEVAIDGRLLPHEWIATPSGLLKTDALDHHADDFRPGCRDIAWDVAGAIAEFDLDPDATAYLVERYCKASGDGTIELRLPFYAAAYLAYRTAYAELAGRTLAGTPDGDRFRLAAARYRRSPAARALPRR